MIRALTRLSGGIVLALVLAVLPRLVGAVDDDSRWSELDESLAQGERHARVWRGGWGAFHGANLGRNVYLASQSSDSSTRFDARVDSVKSVLALGVLWLEPPPYAEAREELRQLRASGDADALDHAEALVAGTAQIEAQRRRPGALAAAFAVNIAGGATIALVDDRPGDGLRNAALGMAVSSLQVWSQPTALRAFHPEGTSARIGPDDNPVTLHYRLSLGPAHAAVDMRW